MSRLSLPISESIKPTSMTHNVRYCSHDRYRHGPGKHRLRPPVGPLRRGIAPRVRRAQAPLLVDPLTSPSLPDPSSERRGRPLSHSHPRRPAAALLALNTLLLVVEDLDPDLRGQHAGQLHQVG